MRPTSIALALLFITLTSSGQQTRPNESLNDLVDSINSLIQTEHIVGLTLGIATQDSVIFSGGFGYADLENKIPVEENTLFRMGSITKMFVSLGISRLVEEGKLHFNDELKKIAPDVPFQNEWEHTHPVRVIHLLEHTSGFDDVKLNAMYSLSSKENHGVDMMLVHKNSMICRWRPGERTAYSNPNYAILGYIIEKLSGKAYDQYLTEIILDPLGMTNSNFKLPYYLFPYTTFFSRAKNRFSPTCKVTLLKTNLWRWESNRGTSGNRTPLRKTSAVSAPECSTST